MSLNPDFHLPLGALAVMVLGTLVGVPAPPAAAQIPGVIEPFDAPSDLFLRANRVYDYGREVNNPAESRRALNTAIPLFREFLNTAPRHEFAEKAWYRLGMSLLLTGQIEEAERVFEGVIKRYRTGKYVATSAYRLGAQRYNDSRWAAAAPYFGITARESDKPKLRHEALYYQARCLILAKDANGASRVLSKIIGDEGNPFADYARLALGQLRAAAGRHEEALKDFELLLTPSTAPQERAQALLAAGVSAAKMENIELAEQYLFQTLDSPGLDMKYKARA
ncbi:MAG: tetratricopeptide repeat protein, partial [Akkermansiaceae bacterium]|nr:tetratricopeptide repeat protein [Akkermansiaceae bacterium]